MIDLATTTSAAIAQELLRRVCYHSGLMRRPPRTPMPESAANSDASDASPSDAPAPENSVIPDPTVVVAKPPIAVSAAPAAEPPRVMPAPVYKAAGEGGIYTQAYDYDGLRTDPAVIHNHDFMRDPRFVKAFTEGSKALGHDHKMFWRLHVALWAVQQVSRLPGDFVEFGVWRGFLSTAIMNYVDWNSLGKHFYLFDTFEGLIPELLTESEKANAAKVEHLNIYFRDTFPFVSEHFKAYPRVTLIKGPVPDTLHEVEFGDVSFVSMDMNCVLPEVAAAEFIWPKLVSGGIILLDDYGFVSYEEQKRAFDKFAAEKNLEVLALPTGQGMIIKP